ncbi:quinone-dependent dihydroorotate dehydrogenase [Rhodococcus sp. BP-252]|uniref:quinone-dependent dihydroorotate dehydrogenase n=1 Tax=unclassified Rhodococcus (in: high G+C Gram-positive bacteria) TaxID=192944 RepID=UPI001C9B795B|nr:MULTISPECIES: quinone-dependent dihydroorotate dehydrogenase [unclassified Rhodococcus (in: high G+C Gram-positive bacteria)]MBY6410039.1 quinone-dependent dihydroorotate dehydrogenase [Rhodococcus sp. BP-320]MBY6415008.1 quinone-dependent dihydroorotate dehydrogenase [Rhodococcus sp. BP-321]MBY6421289.1 quinone-dependent dihydroorotate dehydrogenase [Rhodococcus sp. BP-324]MBY6425684.1 quinone-dependent dihydroorotate dehydrogenase [Rhodococcus sp. BP-323]MBY6429904.1 quinone-dependent dih
MYRALLRLMFLLPPEKIHHIAFGAMRAVTAFAPLRALVQKILVVDDPLLRSTVFGVEFPAPLGLAAGFDKNADGVDAWGPLGFGFAEIGTVTAQAQPGNPQPRLFRLPDDRALVNRMGFNNHGAGAAAGILRGRRGMIPIGANIGKTKVTPAAEAAADYTASATLLGPLADFLVVNVSSPNTPGLRDLQAVESLRPILSAVQSVVSIPVLVKIAPDLTDDDIDAVADLAVELELDGIVATNTTISRTGLRTDRAVVEAAGAGGVSGAPVAERSLEVLRRLYARVGGRIALISVGGIETPDQAWERITAGASLVQGYTGFIYGGPFWMRRINKGIAERVRAGGFSTLSDAVGSASR